MSDKEDEEDKVKVSVSKEADSDDEEGSTNLKVIFFRHDFAFSATMLINQFK